MDDLDALDTWIIIDSPHAKAYSYLQELDLGPDLQGNHAVGGIKSISGGPGSDYRAMQAEDHVSLSLLQERLNQLNTGIRIELI